MHARCIILFDSFGNYRPNVPGQLSVRGAQREGERERERERERRREYEKEGPLGKSASDRDGEKGSARRGRGKRPKKCRKSLAYDQLRFVPDM